MKISSVALMAIGSLVSFKFNEAAKVSSCTHGKLFVVDNSTSNVHVMNLDGSLMDISVEAVVSLPEEGAGALDIYGAPADPVVIQYRGTEDNGYDGYVRVIDSGYSLKDNGDVSFEDASVVSNALIDECHRPIHQVRHDDKIAIFCDGSYDSEPQVNATVHVVDVTKLGSTSESAVIQELTLQGSHHGVAIPVDDGHLLHSLALQDRVERVPDSSSLPATFQVIDEQGNVLHELADVSDPNAHCAGFHGSASIGNTFALACDPVHGGIVIVDYDPANSGYTARALAYPDEPRFDSFRVGSFAYHYQADHFVGSFSLRGGTEYHLMAIPVDATQITPSNILTLPGTERQCAYQYEVGSADHLLVFMPTGVLHIFTLQDGAFTQIAEKEIVPGMVACSEAAFVAGIGQAFVATIATNTLYTIVIDHIDEHGIEVFETTLPFTPRAMTVGGFSLEGACVEGSHDHGDDHGHGHSDDHDHDHDVDSSGPNIIVSIMGGFFLSVVMIAHLI